MPIRTIWDAQWTPKGRLEPIKTKKIKRSPNCSAPEIEPNLAKTVQRPPKDDVKSKKSRQDRQDRKSTQNTSEFHNCLDHLWTSKTLFRYGFSYVILNIDFSKTRPANVPIFGRLWLPFWSTLGDFGPTWVDLGGLWVDLTGLFWLDNNWLDFVAAGGSSAGPGDLHPLE